MTLARLKGDYQTADWLRDELQAIGTRVENHPHGCVTAHAGPWKSWTTKKTHI